MSEVSPRDFEELREKLSEKLRTLIRAVIVP